MNKTLFAIIGLLILLGIGIGGIEAGRRISDKSAAVPTPAADVSAAAAAGTEHTIVPSETSPAGQPAASAPSASVSDEQSYTLADVKKHNTASDCWSAIRDGVYDLTKWISMHPGGERAILQLCGTDGTAKFTGQHGGSRQQEQTLAGFKIGVLAQ